MTEHITDLSDLNRARVYLYGSLREKGFAAKDIDLIVVGVGATEDFNNLDTWADIAYETEKCLDVWLLAPDWGRYACDHHGWSGWGSDLTPADITAGVNSYLGSMARKTLFDPETGEWSFNACVAETGFFGHVDFSAEITPEEVLRLCASRLPVAGLTTRNRDLHHLPPRIVRAVPSSLNGASHPAARDAPAARR